MSNIVKVKHWDIANGEGIRTSIFFSGCEHYCKNCFNSELWSFDIGEEFNREFYENEIKPTINEHVAGISLLGGEPMHPRNIMATCQLIKWFKKDFPDKTVWCWTGYEVEQLLSEQDAVLHRLYWEVFKNIDVLVDGRFIEEQKDLTLKWKGSKNQRVIDTKKTLINHKITLFE